MHVPDGVLDAPTSVATGVVAAAAVGVSLWGARRELDDRTAPMAGLVATFVFAAQMINFPVGAGTSGHLMGGALAAVLVGPWTAVLCLTVVLLVQGLLMADGGITALGTNITLIGIVTVAVGWGVFVVLRRLLPTRLAPVDLGAVATAMLGWHTVIGIGEAVVTGLVVSSVVASRPDLVHGARPLVARRELETRRVEGA